MDKKESADSGQKIIIQEDGPYLVMGGIPLSETLIVTEDGICQYKAGRDYAKKEQYALCRCGHSKNPPYCDGSHEHVHFDGTETASRRPYAKRAVRQRGSGMSLMDDNRCAFARFCHKEHGTAWELTDKSDNRKLREEAISAACDCPSGRLVAVDEAGNEIEPEFEPSIEILQDTDYGVSGPLFVKGYIHIESSDGSAYESRNRVALCRCGKSKNKPFCDATHVQIRFRDNE